MDVESESFYLATVTIKGRYVSIPIVKRFQPKKMSIFLPKFDLSRLKKGLNVNFNYFNPQKVHPCVNPRRLSHRMSKSVEGSDL